MKSKQNRKLPGSIIALEIINTDFKSLGKGYRDDELSDVTQLKQHLLLKLV